MTLTLIPIIYYPLPNVLPDLLPGDLQRPLEALERASPAVLVLRCDFLRGDRPRGVVMWLARRLPERISGIVPRLVGAIAGVMAVVLLATEPNVPEPVVWGFAVWRWSGLCLLSMLWIRPVDSKVFLAMGGAGILALGAVAGITIMNGWARWNYTGYEGKPRWPEYEALMATAADDLEPGSDPLGIRQDHERLRVADGPDAVPLLDRGELRSMEGLFFESSLSTPFHFLNQAEMSVNPSSPIPGLDYHRFDFERGIRHLQIFGVRYYVTFTPEAKAEADKWPELTEITATGPFTIYEVADAPLVEAATFQPAVYEGPHNSLLARLGGVVGIGPGEQAATFEEISLEWYGSMDLLDRWITTDGPAPNGHGSPTSANCRAWTPAGAEATITDVVLEDDLISFRTDAVGVPHLVKVSYFPNWQATGAEGPFHAGPSLMIVVPTQEEVTLQFANGRCREPWLDLDHRWRGRGRRRRRNLSYRTPDDRPPGLASASESLGQAPSKFGLVTSRDLGIRKGLGPGDPPGPHPPLQSGRVARHLPEHARPQRGRRSAGSQLDGRLGQLEPGPLGPHQHLEVVGIPIDPHLGNDDLEDLSSKDLEPGLGFGDRQTEKPHRRQ